MSPTTLCGLTLLFSLTSIACKGGSLTLDDIEDAEDLEEACEEHADLVEEETVRVEFPATVGQCAWGEDGNLDAADGYLTARVEQTRSLDLPDDVVVCDMELSFAGEVGLEQDIVYDDNFLFLFNDVVLASSYAPWVELLPQEGSLRLYDWSTIAGAENLFDSSIPTYCLGEEAGLAECDIPPPETTGPIVLSFDTSITSELSYTAIESEAYDFTFVATGDNDPDTDCAHETFFFEATVPLLDLGAL